MYQIAPFVGKLILKGLSLIEILYHMFGAILLNTKKQSLQGTSIHKTPV